MQCLAVFPFKDATGKWHNVMKFAEGLFPESLKLTLSDMGFEQEEIEGITKKETTSRASTPAQEPRRHRQDQGWRGQRWQWQGWSGQPALAPPGWRGQGWRGQVWQV